MKCVSRSVKPAARARARIGVRRLAREQRLVAGDEVGGQQALGELRRERIGGELQIDPERRAA